jgi:hypothetical protein
VNRSERIAIASAVLVSGLYAFFVLLLPARGMTFYWDDWIILGRLVRLGAPRAWIVPENQQWEPIALAFLHLEHALFGADHTLYLVVQWLGHTGNVLLLALLLRARCGDGRAAAVAALAFGVTTVHREVLWFVVDTTIILCFATTVAGFLALERAREDRSPRALALAMAAVVAAPACWGGGLALGPALVLEAWFLSPRETRSRLAVLLGIAWLAVVALYLAAAAGRAGGALPRSPEALRGALLFAVEVVGLGFVERVPLLDLLHGPLGGLVFTLAYATVVAAVAYALPDRARARLVLAHVYLAILIAPMALTRWRRAELQEPPALASRYQYLPSIVWTTLLALVLARRSTRPVLGAALAVAALHGVRPARRAWSDGSAFSPWARREHWQALEWVRALERVARRARGPIFDAGAPLALATPETRAREILAVVAPDLRVEWTRDATPESLEPYRSEPIFARELPPR